MARISKSDFQKLVGIVYRESGIVLKDKPELVEARLASLARKKKYKDPIQILDDLEKDESGAILIELLDQLSTNLTFFFREQPHFDFLSRVILPELTTAKKANRQRRIRFWSAACSSGGGAVFPGHDRGRIFERPERVGF